METNLIKQAFSTEGLRNESAKLIDFIANKMELSANAPHPKTINWITPDEQLKFWQDDFASGPSNDMDAFWTNVFRHSINFHSRGYMGHQVAVTPAITVLTGAAMAYLNNSTTVYEIGMTANAMEKIVLQYLAKKFGYSTESTGVVTSGGSLGNLTALITARTSSGVPEKDYGKLAIMVSADAHYSVERAAEIMGLPKENILKVPVDEQHRIRTDKLENIYTQAAAQGKLVFSIVGCAGTTAVGAYDDLDKLADFAQTHHLWFHVDGAHGAAVIFSEKYRHYLHGVERSDSLVMDFHKMLLAPSISTAVLYNAKNRQVNEFTPSAAYLWQNQQTEEWYNSAKHTLECTKPITILQTYAILKRYGDALYQQHVDYLYDLGRTFAQLVKEQGNMELAVDPCSNIVCFRCCVAEKDSNALNAAILQKLLKDGEFYIVSTTIDGKFYLRVSLMNPLTKAEDVQRLLAKVEKFANE